MKLDSVRHTGTALLLGLSLAVPADTNRTAAELGLMDGFPPPLAKRVSQKNFMAAPYNRWALQHIRELHPTREVYRGNGAIASLSVDTLDLGSISTAVRNGRELSLAQFLDESHTDSFLILHRGKLVLERYMNGMQPRSQHVMFSATKSFVGTLMLGLIEQGKVDPSRKVIHYLPEMQGSAFADATVQQVLDMTTAVNFTEIYDDPNSEIWRYGWVFRVWGPPPVLAR